MTGHHDHPGQVHLSFLTTCPETRQESCDEAIPKVLRHHGGEGGSHLGRYLTAGEQVAGGNRVICMDELRNSPETLLAGIGKGARCYVSIDIDVLDMS